RIATRDNRRYAVIDTGRRNSSCGISRRKGHVKAFAQCVYQTITDQNVSGWVRVAQHFVSQYGNVGNLERLQYSAAESELCQRFRLAFTYPVTCTASSLTNQGHTERNCVQ